MEYFDRVMKKDCIIDTERNTTMWLHRFLNCGEQINNDFIFV